MNYRLNIVFLFYLINVVVYSQHTNFEFFRTSPDGLSQSVVTDVMQDSKGVLWFSTEDGLNSFDGDVFKRFYREDGLLSHEIECVVEGANEDLWVGTRRGLNLINNNKVVALPSKLLESLKKYTHINKLYFLSDSSLVIATGRFKSKLHIWNQKEMNELILPLEGEYIVNCLIEHENVLFIGTNKGLIAFKDGVFQVFNESKDLRTNIVNCFSIFKDNLIIGSNKGLIFHKNDSFFYDSTFSNFENKNISNLSSHNNSLVFSEFKEFVYLYKDSEIQIFDKSQGLSSTKINDLLIDREGSIWISFSGFGLAKFREKPFISYDEFNRFELGHVNSMFVDNAEKLWVGSTKGLQVKLKNELYFKRYLPKYDFANCKIKFNSVSSILEDVKERIWICTPMSAIIIYENDSFRQLNIKENELTNLGFDPETVKNILSVINDPRTLCLDNNGFLWIGSFTDGIVVLDKNLNCIKYLSKKKGLRGDLIQCFFKDSYGNIWIGSASGLTRISGDSIEIFDDYKELKKSTYSIKEDHFGNILVATDFGLYKLFLNDDQLIKQVKHYDIKNGLASSVVYAMEIDDAGNLYLGTTLGVDRVTKESFNDYNIVNKHYGPDEGFKGVECNTNASFKDHNGDLWFGTNSVSKLRINLDVIDTIKPNIFINDIRLNYLNVPSWDLKNGSTQNILGFDKPVFFYNQNHLTFDYKAITGVSPKNIRYSFKIEPIDVKWNPKTKQRFSTYSNLSPGSYTFKVKAENIDKTESEIVSYSFQIAKPWWDEYWFYLIEVSAGLLLIFGFISIRERRLKLNQIILEKKVKQRTSQLNAEKVKVESQNKEIKKSINYARRIQNSILPDESLMDDYFEDFMVFYQPKDIVGGDFYWFRCFGNISVIASVDCTGHGVPGGFMSMMGSLLLDKIVQSHNLETSKILKDLNSEIVRVLDQESGGEIQDGMDISLCVIDKQNRKVSFSGARNGITIIRADKIEKYDADLFSVGGSYTKISRELKRDFKSYSIDLEPNDWLYMYTDGYYDQLGEKKMRSLGLKKFEEIIKECSSFKENKNQFLSEKFNLWKGELPQIDDLLIIGFKV